MKKNEIIEHDEAIKEEAKNKIHEISKTFEVNIQRFKVGSEARESYKTILPHVLAMLDEIIEILNKKGEIKND